MPWRRGITSRLSRASSTKRSLATRKLIDEIKPIFERAATECDEILRRAEFMKQQRGFQSRTVSANDREYMAAGPWVNRPLRETAAVDNLCDQNAVAITIILEASMAILPRLGTGDQAIIEGLLIKVDVAENGWRYVISRGTIEVARHQPCWPENQTHELAHLEAVTTALEFLKRSDDPAMVATRLNWVPL